MRNFQPSNNNTFIAGDNRQQIHPDPSNPLRLCLKILLQKKNIVGGAGNPRMSFVILNHHQRSDTYFVG